LFCVLLLRRLLRLQVNPSVEGNADLRSWKKDGAKFHVEERFLDK
jgi:hypothetical protein